MDFTISFADVLKVFGAIIAFILALCQYVKAQKWKRAEFVYQIMKNFNDDFNVKRAYRMLDWLCVEIPLLPNELQDGESLLDKKTFLYKEEILITALRPHFNMKKENGDSFTDEEAVIRFIFDDFFDKLGQFNQFIKKGLLTKDDVETYLIYWIKRIADPNNKITTNQQQLRNYLVEYEFNDVIELCARFNFNLNC